jgi:hypothetical protein
VACDQPFDEVEKPEFIEMMQYGHHAVPNFTLPKREGVQRRVMKLGEKTINDIKGIFTVSFYSFKLLINLLNFHQRLGFRQQN